MGSATIQSVVATCDSRECGRQIAGNDPEVTLGDLLDANPAWLSGTVDYGTVKVEWLACRETHIRDAVTGALAEHAATLDGD